MLACGMPNSYRTGCDFELDATTVWKRLVRNDDNDERAEDVIMNQCFKRWSRILWSLVSNAAERSIRRVVEWPESIDSKISFWTRSRAVSEEWNLRWANWHSDIRPLEERCNWSWLAITHSINFEGKDRLKIGRKFFMSFESREVSRVASGQSEKRK